MLVCLIVEKVFDSETTPSPQEAQQGQEVKWAIPFLNRGHTFAPTCQKTFVDYPLLCPAAGANIKNSIFPTGIYIAQKI